MIKSEVESEANSIIFSNNQLRVCVCVCVCVWDGQNKNRLLHWQV